MTLLAPCNDQAAGRLLKARHERSRPRTRERALLVMEQLSEALLKGHDQDVAATAPAAAGGCAIAAQQHQLKLAAVRQRLAYSVSFPLQVVLRKELAEHYVSLGFVGESPVQPTFLTASAGRKDIRIISSDAASQSSCIFLPGLQWMASNCYEQSLYKWHPWPLLSFLWVSGSPQRTRCVDI